MSEPTASDNATMVFNALSDAPVSAKSVQVATGLTYQQVKDALETLEARGTATRETKGSRTLWAIAADNAPAPADPEDNTSHIEPPADEPADAAADVAPESEPGRPKVQAMSKADLLAEANDVHGLRLPKATKKADLEAAVIAARNADWQRRQARKALTDRYNAMSAKDVKALAKEREIPGYTSKKKADLVEALADQDEAPADATPGGAAESAADAPATPDGPWGTPDGSTAATDELGAVLDGLRAVAPVSAPPAQAARRPRADGAPAGGIVASGQARAWTRGELESTLIQRMADVPDEEHSATTLTKWWNGQRAADAPFAQAGSVAFALEQAVKRGTARYTQESPKRYAAVQPALA